MQTIKKAPNKRAHIYHYENDYNINDVIDQFSQAIINHGAILPDHIIADGQKHRFSTNKKTNDTAGEYCLYIDHIPAGYYIDHRSKLYFSWRYRVNNYSTQNYHTHHLEAFNKIIKQRNQIKHNQAREKAQRIWNYSINDVRHPYLNHKQVKNYGLRQLGSSLVMPLMDTNQIIHTLQFIQPDGSKKLLSGGVKKGHFCCIGNIVNKALVCEGYATGATLFYCTNIPTIIAIDAGNLLHVGKAIKQTHPDCELIYCADNDQYGVSNTGVDKAILAAKLTNSIVAIPNFNDLSTKPTDFNDLYRLEGVNAILGGIR